MKKQVCVIGLGRFGATVARELYQAGHDILAMDTDEAKIQEMLGHADISTTQIYTAVESGRILDQHDRFHPRNR